MEKIKVHYILDEMWDYPPPILFFYIKGNKGVFNQFSSIIEMLSFKYMSLVINDSDLFEIDTAKKIIFKSSKGGNTIGKLNDSEILFDLDFKYWKILHDVSVNFSKTTVSLTYFVEFNDLETPEVIMVWEC